MLLVDAANVVGSVPNGWWRDRAGAAARLVARLRAADLGPVVVVLEGAARTGASEGVQDDVEVVHAPGSGDDALAARCRPGVVLVSADRGLRARAAAAGARCEGPAALLARLAD